jgi:aminoglycoside phosphotransferase
VEEKVENNLQELFWKLVELRVPPENERITVLIHGAANLDNIMFSYDEFSGRPNQVSEALNKAIKFHYFPKR